MNIVPHFVLNDHVTQTKNNYFFLMLKKPKNLIFLLSKLIKMTTCSKLYDCLSARVDDKSSDEYVEEEEEDVTCAIQFVVELMGHVANPPRPILRRTRVECGPILRSVAVSK